MLLERSMNATGNAILDAGLTRAETQSVIVAENWRLLRYINIFRLLIAIPAAALALSSAHISPFGDTSRPWFAIYSIAYAAIALIAIATLHQRRPSFETQTTMLAFLDVAFITLIMHTSGGLTSGLGLLLVLSVAASSFLLGRRMTIFFASLATVAILIEYSWSFLTGVESWNADGYPQAGLLGLAIFAAASLSFTLAARLRATEALAEKRGVDLANLAQVNALIIERMQAGVLVCSPSAHVVSANKAASQFLGLQSSSPAPALADVNPDLATQLFQWLENPESRVRRLLRTRSGYTLLPRFAPIGETHNHGVLVFLEDTSILRQQAQQLKMAALARLTASIAHEIRNPLGAIANAGQLLAESSTGGREEQRLIRIIEDQSRRMNTIVESVMQLSRRDHVNPVRLELEPWLRDFVMQFSEPLRLPPDAIVILGPPEIWVCFDPDQLYQVAANLCQNALRHSPQFSGKCLIEIETGIDDENLPFLDVIDWGTGVPPDVVDNIFDPFFTTTPKGTGLGLYIARELCEGNGGRLEYHPGEGVGARFRVTFSKAEECAEIGL